MSYYILVFIVIISFNFGLCSASNEGYFKANPHSSQYRYRPLAAKPWPQSRLNTQLTPHHKPWPQTHLRPQLHSLSLVQLQPYPYPRTYLRPQPQPRLLTHPQPYYQAYLRPQPQYPVCGCSKGVLRTFRNIGELKHLQKRGYHWKFYAWGACPPSRVPPNQNTPVWAKRENEIRKFSNMQEFRQINNDHKWTIIPCPVTSQAVCATFCGETRIFRDLVALRLLKYHIKQNWISVTCPNLVPTMCLRAANNYFSNNQALRSWIITTCSFGNVTQPNYQTTTPTTEKGLATEKSTPTTTLQDATICAQYKNEVRKFDSVLALVSEKCVSRKDWKIVTCPINNATICAIHQNEQLLVSKMESLRVVKLLTGKGWVVSTCPDLIEPICFNFEFDFIFQTIKAWLIIPCQTVVAITNTTTATTEASVPSRTTLTTKAATASSTPATIKTTTGRVTPTKTTETSVSVEILTPITNTTSTQASTTGKSEKPILTVAAPTTERSPPTTNKATTEAETATESTNLTIIVAATEAVTTLGILTPTTNKTTTGAATVSESTKATTSVTESEAVTTIESTKPTTAAEDTASIENSTTPATNTTATEVVTTIESTNPTANEITTDATTDPIEANTTTAAATT